MCRPSAEQIAYRKIGLLAHDAPFRIARVHQRCTKSSEFRHEALLDQQLRVLELFVIRDAMKAVHARVRPRRDRGGVEREKDVVRKLGFFEIRLVPKSGSGFLLVAGNDAHAAKHLPFRLQFGQVGLTQQTMDQVQIPPPAQGQHGPNQRIAPRFVMR